MNSYISKQLNIAGPITKQLARGFETFSSSYAEPLSIDLSSSNITQLSAGQGVCSLFTKINLEDFVNGYSRYYAVLPISATVKLVDYQDWNQYGSYQHQYTILTTKDVYLRRYIFGGNPDSPDSSWSLQGDIIANIDHTFTKLLTTIKYQILLNGIAIY